MRDHLALAEVRQHFNVCGVYDLCAYINCMPLLYEDLKQQRQDVYNPNDRLVFLLYDLDYTLHDWTPGFAIYNLQLILQDLDISNYYALILTNRTDYNQYTRQVQQTLTSDAHHIRSITTFLDQTWIEPVDTQPNSDQIQQAFSVLSRQSRPHRSYFVAKLQHSGLCNHAQVGYHNLPFPHQDLVPQSLRQRSSQTDCSHLGLLSAPTASQRLLLRDVANQNIYQNFVSNFTKLVNFEESVDIDNKEACMMISASTPVQRCLIYLGLETDVALAKPHVSPISLRGITARRPFILLAAPGTLKILRSLGFRVFDEWWDTSYDDIVDFEQRVDRIIEIMRPWAKLSAAQLQKKYLDMQRDVDYNYQFYLEEFEPLQRQQLNLALTANGRGE